MNIFEYRGPLVLINIALFLFAIIRYKDVYKGINNSRSQNYLAIGVLLALYSIFAFAEGDTYHYEEIFQNMSLYHDIVHVEPFYFWLSTLTSSYFLWRTMIWGAATVLFVMTIKRLNINANVFGFLMPGLLFYQFSLTRGVLGFALLFFSLTLIYCNRKSIIWISLAVIGIICSFSLHRSIAVFIAVLPLAYIMPFTKKTIWIYLLLFPVLYGIVAMAPQYLLNSISFSEDTVSSANMYLEMEEAQTNIFGLIQLLWKWSGIVWITLLSSFYYANNRENTDNFISYMSKYAFLLVYISFLFYGQDMSSFISSRTLHAAGFPLMLTACYYYQYKERTKVDKIGLLLTTSYGLFSLIYFCWKFSI